MVWVDHAIIGIIVFSALLSLGKGFLQEALSLAIWLAAFFVANYFCPYLSYYLRGIQDESIRHAIAIVILFIATLIVGSIVSNLLQRLIAYSGLTTTDRLLGFCFGLLRGVLMVAAILFLCDTFTSLARSQVWQQSVLIPHFAYIIEWFFDYLRSHSSLLSGYSPSLLPIK